MVGTAGFAFPCGKYHVASWNCGTKPLVSHNSGFLTLALYTSGVTGSWGLFLTKRVELIRHRTTGLCDRL